SRSSVDWFSRGPTSPPDARLPAGDRTGVSSSRRGVPGPRPTRFQESKTVSVTFDTSRQTGPLSVGLVSTYPPTRCGIGRFTHALRRAWVEADPTADVRVARILRGPAEETDPAVETVFD